MRLYAGLHYLTCLVDSIVEDADTREWMNPQTDTDIDQSQNSQGDGDLDELIAMLRKKLTKLPCQKHRASEQRTEKEDGDDEGHGVVSLCLRV